MARRPSFTAIEPAAEPEEPPAVAEWVEADWEEAEAPPGGRIGDWLFPSFAFLAAMAWTNLFVWANYDAITSRPAPAQWLGWISGWAAPVALIALVWLIAQRPLRESGRFGDAARRVGSDAAALEARLAGVNRELSLARAFLAEQTRELDRLGRSAGERLSAHADRLAQLIAANATRIDGIGTVSAAAMENMEALRGQLPVLASLSKDVTNAIGTAGRTAQAQLADMVAGLTRLNEFGTASERQVATLGSAVGASVGALDAALAKIDGEAARIGGEIARTAAAQDAAAARLGEQRRAGEAAVADAEARLTTLLAGAEAAETALGAKAAAVAARLAESRAAVADTDAALARLTDASVRLLELIQASVAHSGERLPRAIGAGEARLAALETRAIALRDTIDAAGTSGDALAAHVLATHDRLGDATRALTRLQSELAKAADRHAAALGTARDDLGAIDARSAALAERTRGELTDAVAGLAAAADAAFAAIDEAGGEQIAELAQRFAAESSDAIEAAMVGQADGISGRIEAAGAAAAAASREATVQLRDQLVKVDELVGNLERRVAQSRERAEEQVDGDFSRRAALITDALNSQAIDLTRALSPEIADTAWAAYLRGDRGIFTRRAVRLLDTGEARAVAEMYAANGVFRDNVSRYIHDFEAMLRQLLSTRDGHALGVTLLSSDMGKLYVALAQAIERLRT